MKHQFQVIISIDDDDTDYVADSKAEEIIATAFEIYCEQLGYTGVLKVIHVKDLGDVDE